MADIGGVSGFNPDTSRSIFDAEAAVQRRAEERARQEELQEERRIEGEEELQQAEDAEAEQEAAAREQEQLNQDEVQLSNAAQDFLIEQENQAQAANDDATVNAATQVGVVDGTNQAAGDEENNAAVNGSEDDESEQTRALGQIVDQFA